MLSNSLGTDLSTWDRQVPVLSRSFRILRYDGRGHGRSLTTPGPYAVETLARDVVDVLDHLKISRVHFCGLSLGGMIGLWLGAHEPARVNRLVLANTAAQLGPREAWEARIQAIRRGGMAAVAGEVVERWFTPAFRRRVPDAAEAMRRMLLAASPEGYAACCAAVRDMDQRVALSAVRSDALVIGGRYDVATPPATCRAIADAIPGARYLELPAAHLSNIEAEEPFTTAVLDFLTS